MSPRDVRIVCPRPYWSCWTCSSPLFFLNIVCFFYIVPEEVLLRVKEQRNILREIRKRKANLIGHILRRNCLLQWIIEGKIQGGIEVTVRQGRRRTKLLDDLKERRGCSHLKEEAQNRTMWTARFGRGFRPVVRQTTKRKWCIKRSQFYS